MRSATLVVLVVASLSCSRPNPAYDPGPGQSTGATSPNGEGSTEAGSAEVGSVGPNDDTSADSSSGSGPVDCVPSSWLMEPIKDNTLVSEGLCSNTECLDANYGLLEFGLLRDFGEGQRGYLLMTFDLSGFQRIMPGAELLLWIENPVEAFRLEAKAVLPPSQWGEGGGVGEPAQPGESSWRWSARPTAWNPDAVEMNFFSVLEQGVPLGAEPYEPFEGLDVVIFPIDADDLIDHTDEQGLLHVAVTNTVGPDFLTVFTRNGFELSPVLAFDGC